MSISTLDRQNALNFDIAAVAWLPRLSVAATFLYHGFQKLPLSAETAAGLGLPYWLFVLVVLFEIGGGLLLIAGGALRHAAGDLLTRMGGAAVSVIMVGAILKFHLGPWPGMEFQVLMLALGLTWVARGNRA